MTFWHTGMRVPSFGFGGCCCLGRGWFCWFWFRVMMVVVVVVMVTVMIVMVTEHFLVLQRPHLSLYYVLSVYVS